MSDARSGLGLVNQVAYHAQLRDTATPPKPPLSAKSPLYWSNELDEAPVNSKQAIVDAIRHGGEIRDPIKPTNLHTDHSQKGPGCYSPQKHCGCTGLDPKCCEDGWESMPSGSRPPESTETYHVPLEGECRGSVSGCSSPPLLTDHNPPCKTLRDKAMVDSTNSKALKLREITLPWKFVT